MFYEAFPEYFAFQYLKIRLMARREAALNDERGMTTETVIITAVLALLAVTVTVIIFTRVRNRANTIDVDTAPTP